MSTDALPLPDPATLPGDVETLRQLILQLLQALRGERSQVEKLQHQIDLLLKRLYGRTSEKLDPRQQALFDTSPEEGIEAPPLPREEVAVELGTNSDKRRGHGRRPKPDTLERVDVVHDLSEAEKQALAGDGELVEIGQEITEQYEWRESCLYVVRHIQKKYARRPQLLESGPAADEKNVIVAAKPAQPIPGGIAGPGLLAHVIVAHHADHLPYHRLERILGRAGVPFSRQTTNGWALEVAERVYPSLLDVLWHELLASHVIHTDDTPVLVVDAHGKLRYTGRFWTYVGDQQHPLTAFQFTPSHSRDGPGGPAEFLHGFAGYLQADAFSGYDALYLGADSRILEVACWAHARRKFVEAQRADSLRAQTALAYIAQLYGLEKELRKQLAGAWSELPRSEQHARVAAERQAHARPVLARFAEWLEAEAPKLVPKNPIRAAMEYARRNWVALERYTDEGFLAIDNNLAERALRGIALGRNNWLFRGSDRGGRAAAAHFSLIASCLRNQVEPCAYLRDLLTRLPAMRNATRDELRALLPDLWRPAAA